MASQSGLGVRQRESERRCTKHDGCRTLINNVDLTNTRRRSGNFQVTYYCECRKSCLVICTACAVLCEVSIDDPCPEIVYEASSDLICDKSLTSAKKNHQRCSRQSIHRVYVPLELRYISGAFDRPERMFQSGTPSGQPSSQYGKVQGLLVATEI
jgi:hypothetical protein